jgi:RNA recognition motif-containing protein
MNIYVGNLSYDVNDDDLRRAFEAFGRVDTVNIIQDRYSGMSKGFAFVEMAEKTEAQAAIAGLNGKDLKGRTLNVNEARPRDDGRRSGGGGGGGGGGRPGGPGGRRPGGGGGGGGGGRRTW